MQPASERAAPCHRWHRITPAACLAALGRRRPRAMPSPLDSKKNKNLWAVVMVADAGTEQRHAAQSPRKRQCLVRRTLTRTRLCSVCSTPAGTLSSHGLLASSASSSFSRHQPPRVLLRELPRVSLREALRAVQACRCLAAHLSSCSFWLRWRVLPHTQGSRQRQGAPRNHCGRDHASVSHRHHDGARGLPSLADHLLFLSVGPFVRGSWPGC